MEIDRCLQLLSRLSQLTVLTIVVIMSIVLAGLRVKGYQLLGVQTASMMPVFRPGDALIVAPVLTRQLRPGQIVSYRSNRDPRVIISHRLINFDGERLITQGDALVDPDPAVRPEQVLGRPTVMLPSFGYVLAALREPLGLAGLVVLPAAIILISEYRRLVAAWSLPLYRPYR